jgi:hypothetical protein
MYVHWLGVPSREDKLKKTNPNKIDTKTAIKENANSINQSILFNNNV